MTDDKLNLVLASAMIRALVAKMQVFDIPEAVNAGRLKLIEEAAGLTVGVDGNCGFALVGKDLAVGESAFVQIEEKDGLAYERAQAAAVAQLYENLIQKGPMPVATARAIADAGIAICEAHDAKDHGGRVCRDSRVTLAGYFAHCLGIGDMEGPLVLEELLELNARCPHKKPDQPCRNDGEPEL